MQYRIVYTETAANDIAEKFQYIVQVFRDRALAERWYARLKVNIQQDLSFMPEKYQLYDIEPWRSKGIRLFLTKQDVVLYSFDGASIYIHGVCTAGREISAHLQQTTDAI